MTALAGACEPHLNRMTDLVRILNTSRATIYRDIADGLMAKPKKRKGPAYWTREDVRAYVASLAAS